MGYALEKEESGKAEASALEGLQDKLLAGESIFGADLQEALQKDLEAGEKLSLVHLEKYLQQAEDLSTSQLMQMILVLRTAMVSTLAADPDVFLTYAHAAVMCVKAMERKAE